MKRRARGWLVAGASAGALAWGFFGCAQPAQLPDDGTDSGNTPPTPGKDGGGIIIDGSVPPLADGGCPGATTRCGNACYDLQTSKDNCGKCGSPCAMTEACEMGACHLACMAPTARCNVAPPDGGMTVEQCINTNADPKNCGMCGKACNNGWYCDAGGCDLACGMGLTKCSNACVDTNTDPANCGGCNSPCGMNQVCKAGVCTSFTNIATSGTVTISGGGNTGNYVPAKANDGISEAQNCNLFAWITAGSSPGGAWIQVQWGATHTVTQVKMDTLGAAANSCGANGRTLGYAQVQYYSNNAWVTDGTVSGQLNDWTYNFAQPRVTDRVRLYNVYATNQVGQQSNPVVFEMEVIGN